MTGSINQQTSQENDPPPLPPRREEATDINKQVYFEGID